MKRFVLWVVLSLMSLPALAIAQQAGLQSSGQDRSSTASVAGTTWAGTDSDGDYYEYTFQVDGVLRYKSPSGTFTHGTWKQDGDAIYMETNEKYSEYQGRISGMHMEGNAWNTKGRKWTWAADKK